jgi:hypothetical protein
VQRGPFGPRARRLGLEIVTLQSQEDWAESVAVQVLQGRRYLTRSLPGFGKSLTANRVAVALGESAVLIRGRDYVEESQERLAQNLRTELVSRVESHGSAQLIFDDYHVALGRSRGARLQSLLVALLVDGEYSRDIGALLFTRQASIAHLHTAGSPLVGRFDELDLPTWTDEECLELGLDPAVISKEIGRSAAMLAFFIEDCKRDLDYLVRRLEIDAQSIVGDLTMDAMDRLCGRSASSRGLHELISDAGEPTDIVARSGLLALAHQQNTGWPAERVASAEMFASLLIGSGRALWSDRYLFTDISRLEHHLRLVRERVGTRIELLGSPNPGNARLDRSRIKAVLEKIPDVEVRFMPAAAYGALHDRHLALSGQTGGWVLPMAAAIIGRQPVGSAVATRAPTFGVDYPQIWANALR